MIGRLVVENLKHIWDTNITSEECMHEQIIRHQGDWRIVLDKQHQGMILSAPNHGPQAPPQKYQQAKVCFPKQGR